MPIICIGRKELLLELIKEIHIYPEGENEYPLKSIKFNFPILQNGKEVDEIFLNKQPKVETLVCLTRKWAEIGLKWVKLSLFEWIWYRNSKIRCSKSKMSRFRVGTNVTFEQDSKVYFTAVRYDCLVKSSLKIHWTAQNVWLFEIDGL